MPADADLTKVVSGSMTLQVPDAAAFVASAQALAAVQAAVAVSAALPVATAVNVVLAAARRLASHESGRRLTGSVNADFSFDSSTEAATSQTAALGPDASGQLLVRINQQLAQRGVSALSVSGISSVNATNSDQPESGAGGTQYFGGFFNIREVLMNAPGLVFAGCAMKLLLVIFTFAVFSGVKERFSVREGCIVTAFKVLFCMPCYFCQVLGHCEHLTEIGLLGNVVGVAQP